MSKASLKERMAQGAKKAVEVARSSSLFGTAPVPQKDEKPSKPARPQPETDPDVVEITDTQENPLADMLASLSDHIDEQRAAAQTPEDTPETSEAPDETEEAPEELTDELEDELTADAEGYDEPAEEDIDETLEEDLAALEQEEEERLKQQIDSLAKDQEAAQEQDSILDPTPDPTPIPIPMPAPEPPTEYQDPAKGKGAKKDTKGAKGAKKGTGKPNQGKSKGQPDQPDNVGPTEPMDHSSNRRLRVVTKGRIVRENVSMHPKEFYDRTLGELAYEFDATGRMSDDLFKWILDALISDKEVGEDLVGMILPILLQNRNFATEVKNDLRQLEAEDNPYIAAYKNRLDSTDEAIYESFEDASKSIEHLTAAYGIEPKDTFELIWLKKLPKGGKKQVTEGEVRKYCYESAGNTHKLLQQLIIEPRLQLDPAQATCADTAPDTGEKSSL